MGRTKRKFYKGILNHCYQRTANRILLFYSESDFLVFFTIFCIEARKYRVVILSLCQMPDHIHVCICAESMEDLSGFVRSYTQKFAFVQNKTCNWKGALFETPFGSAPKYGDKKARTNLIYIGNNAPERRLCSKAEQYRWNYIAYAASNNPYSNRIVIRYTSFSLIKAIREVRYSFSSGKPLQYTQLQRLFKTLTRTETEQFIDYCISLYNVIDYEKAISFFGTYDRMLTAMHSNTGSEYDINERFTGKSDLCYANMSSLIMEKLKLDDVHDMFLLPEKERIKLIPFLKNRTDAFPEQIAAFLRLPHSDRKTETTIIQRFK